MDKPSRKPVTNPGAAIISKEEENRRATGARALKHFDDTTPEPPLEGPTVPAPDKPFGLSEPASDTEEKTRESDHE